MNPGNVRNSFRIQSTKGRFLCLAFDQIRFAGDGQGGQSFQACDVSRIHVLENLTEIGRLGFGPGYLLT